MIDKEKEIVIVEPNWHIVGDTRGKNEPYNLGEEVKICMHSCFYLDGFWHFLYESTEDDSLYYFKSDGENIVQSIKT